MLGWELPPHNSGGLGVACYQLCKALAKKGAGIEFILPYTAAHDIDFMRLTPAHPQDVREIIASGIAYDSYKYIFHDGSEEWVDMFGQQLAYEQAVAKIAERAEFDIIHAHDWLTFRAAVRAKQQSGKTLIAHVHSIERDRAGGQAGNPLVREIEETTLLLADRVVAVSQLTKQAIVADYAIPAEKIEVVHNSLDLDDAAPLDDTSAHHYLMAMKANGYRVVANIGRLTIQKGLPQLLSAAREVITRQPKTLFLIVGAGEQYFELIELAAELGISSNVIFAGFQRGKHWRDSYAIADLFVMPSISEPFGLTPLEAAGYGTPSLISRQSGVAEVLQNCLKIDYWDVNEMANQITAAVRNDALCEVLSANVQQEYQKLSWDKAANTLLDLYQTHQPGATA